MSAPTERPGPALPLTEVQWPPLESVAGLADAPLAHVAVRLHDASLLYPGSSARVIFTADCTGRPQKKAGEEEIISRVQIAELAKTDIWNENGQEFSQLSRLI